MTHADSLAWAQTIAREVYWYRMRHDGWMALWIVLGCIVLVAGTILFERMTAPDPRPPRKWDPGAWDREAHEIMSREQRQRRGER